MLQKLLGVFSGAGPYVSWPNLALTLGGFLDYTHLLYQPLVEFLSQGTFQASPVPLWTFSLPFVILIGKG